MYRNIQWAPIDRSTDVILRDNLEIYILIRTILRICGRCEEEDHEKCCEKTFHVLF